MRNPALYADWRRGAWAGQRLGDVPIQEAITRNPHWPNRGHDGQRFPWRAAMLSTNAATPALGYNSPRPRVLFIPKRYLVQSINQKKPLLLRGVSSNVSTYDTSALTAMERRVANQ